jgi:hypothetical protein
MMTFGDLQQRGLQSQDADHTWGALSLKLRQEACPTGTQAFGIQGQAFVQVMWDNYGAVDLEGHLATVPLVTVPLATSPLAILYKEIPSLFKPKS